MTTNTPGTRVKVKLNPVSIGLSVVIAGYEKRTLKFVKYREKEYIKCHSRRREVHFKLAY